MKRILLPNWLVPLLLFVPLVPRLVAADFAEGNAAQWGTFASDGAMAQVSDDTTLVKVGASSLRFDTASGFDTGVRYPKTGALHWSITTNTHLAFWLYGIDTNQPTWQGNQPPHARGLRLERPGVVGAKRPG